MKRIKLNIITSRSALRQLLLLASFITLLLVSGCAGSYNSQKNWNRSPASTGHNRCGCLLTPVHHHAIKMYQQPVYALQA